MYKKKLCSDNFFAFKAMYYNDLFSFVESVLISVRIFCCIGVFVSSNRCDKFFIYFFTKMLNMVNFVFKMAFARTVFH